ncbi:MAG: GtrA family protein [Anaerolineae bacterium]|nr:GtrA family protein [Anaerolineae bacterium]
MIKRMQHIERMSQNNDDIRATQGGFLTRLNDRHGYIRRFSLRYGGSRAKELERLIKFLFVGGLGAIIDLGLTNFLMIYVFHVQDGDVLLVTLSACIGFTTAVCSNFFWNRYWTYPDSRSRSVRRQLVQFFIVSVIGLGVRALTVSMFTNPFADVVRRVTGAMNLDLAGYTQYKLGANLAIMLALVIVAFWNFLANRFWTYNDVG